MVVEDDDDDEDCENDHFLLPFPLPLKAMNFAAVGILKILGFQFQF